MDLRKFIPGKSEEPTREYYWSLIIEPGWVTAGMWTISDKEAKVITTSLPVAWEGETELINAADSVLSAAVQGFPEGVEEPSKTVFGVSSGWVQNGEIKAERLSTIKEVCTKLSLTPIGFVVIPEAISHLTKSNEGSLPNVITVGVYKDSVEVSVFRLGKLAGTTQVSRSVNLDEDVIEGISRFVGDEPIPTRFILYNSKEGELEDARQSLIRVNWEDYSSLKLLHTPKIEIMVSDQKVEAVCLAGASEIADVTRLTREPVVMAETMVAGAQEVLSEEEETTAEDLGFVVESERNMGGKETSGKSVAKKEEFSEEILEDEVSNVIPAQIHNDFVSAPGQQPPESESGTMSKTLGNLKANFDRKPLIFGLFAFVLILVLGTVLWWFVPTATVTVYVSPQKLDEKVRIKIDKDAGSPNVSDGVLPAKEKKVDVSGEKTGETTGTKTVGDKAGGEVTLYRVGPAISVKAGTILLGPQNLKFVLDETINVASGSAGSPGTTKAKASADGIGAQYNLAGGSNFTVGNFSTSDIEAKNETSFSGGTSRQISSISEGDRKTLKEGLVEELTQKAMSEISDGLSANEVAVKESSSYGVENEDFSGKVGDEATVLKLSLAMGVKVLVINKSQLETLIAEKLGGKVPEGYAMPTTQLDFQFVHMEENNYDVEVVANMVPRVDSQELSKKIRGKLIKTAGEILEREVPGFAGVEIRIKPVLPGRLKTLPHVLKNITVDLSAEK